MSNYEQQKDLGTQGKEDTFMGKVKQVAGKFQRKAGQATGNRDMQARGTGREVGGKVQSAGGQVEQKVDNALHPNETAGERASTTDQYNQNI